MELEAAMLVAGTETPIGAGTTGALRCVIETRDGSRKAAVLKRGPVGEVAAEAFCALLFHAWGLAVPHPYLIIEDDCLSFAGADVGYPNLNQRFGLDALPDGELKTLLLQQICRLIVSFPSSPLAAACDEAAQNRDRNTGNVLWDGSAEIWIDHAFTLGQGNPDIVDRNKLCMIAIRVGESDRFQTSATAQGLLLDRDKPRHAEAAVAVTNLGSRGYAEFVADRLSSLGNRIISRFPQPADLLQGIAPYGN